MRDLEAENRELRAVSEGRLKALNEKAEEAKREWVRAENAEALLAAANKEREELKARLVEEQSKAMTTLEDYNNLKRDMRGYLGQLTLEKSARITVEAERDSLKAQLAAENAARVRAVKIGLAAQDRAKRAEAELAKARAWRKQAEKGMGSDKWLPEEMAKLEERAEKAEKDRDTYREAAGEYAIAAGHLSDKVEAAQRRVEEFVRRFKAYNDGGRTQAQWESLCDLVASLSRATEQGKAAPGPLPLDNWTEDQKRIALEQLSDEPQAAPSEPTIEGECKVCAQMFTVKKEAFAHARTTGHWVELVGNQRRKAEAKPQATVGKLSCGAGETEACRWEEVCPQCRAWYEAAIAKPSPSRQEKGQGEGADGEV